MPSRLISDQRNCQTSGPRLRVCRFRHPRCIFVLLHRRCGAEESSDIAGGVGEESRQVNCFAGAVAFAKTSQAKTPCFPCPKEPRSVRRSWETSCLTTKGPESRSSLPPCPFPVSRIRELLRKRQVRLNSYGTTELGHRRNNCPQFGAPGSELVVSMRRNDWVNSFCDQALMLEKSQAYRQHFGTDAH